MQEAVRWGLEEAGDAQLVAGEYVRSQAGKSVRKRLKKLLDEARGLADAEQHERHHAMRIAAKRLRYTLELARPIASPISAEIGDAVKKLQTLLGEVHDCDVWVGTSRISPARKRAKSDSTSAVHNGSNVCGPASTICGRSERTVAARPSANWWPTGRNWKIKPVWDRADEHLRIGSDAAKSQAKSQDKSDESSRRRLAASLKDRADIHGSDRKERRT